MIMFIATIALIAAVLLILQLDNIVSYRMIKNRKALTRRLKEREYKLTLLRRYKKL